MPAALPDWAVAVEEAVALAAARGARPPGATDSWAEAFAVPFRPFLAAAGERLLAGGGRCLTPAQADLGLIGQAFTNALGRQLARLAVRTMLAELDAARARGVLAGADGRQRFDAFLRQQCTRDRLAALFGDYPVLGRLLGTASQLAAEASLEMLTRLAADHAVLVETLFGGTDPGPVVAIEPGRGDRHGRGRSVTVLSFAGGGKVIYKPTDMRAYLLFCEIARWVSAQIPGCALRTAGIVTGQGYGWLEFIAHESLPRPGAASDFYRRAGLLLAALYAANGADIHGENLIAAGDQPVVVDAETLLHPLVAAPLVTGDDPAAQALAASVHHTGLLPCVVADEHGVADRSGLGGGQDGTNEADVLDWDPPASDDTRLVWRAAPVSAMRNRPRIRGGVIEPAEYETAVLEGFRLGYEAIAGSGREFAALLEASSAIEVRVVVRASAGYARMLEELTHPDMLHDARDREAALAGLQELSADHPLWRRLARHEIIDLWAGDIPRLTSRPAARDIWTSAGERLPDLLERPGLDCALEKIAAMSEVDRRDQEWIISATLASRRPTAGHDSPQPAGGPVTPTAAEPGRLLTAACGLADQLVARGMTGGEASGQPRVNWIGLQLVDRSRWMVLPMGAGLADGYLGVALFLAQLADLTGVDRYADVARRAVSPLPRLLDSLAGRPDLLCALGCGLTEGMGGISYGLTRVATLLDDPVIKGWAGEAASLTAAVCRLTEPPPGWSDGSAGCLAAMTAVRSEAGFAVAGDAAGMCAGLLTDLVEHTGGRCVSGGTVPRGFAAGPAGVGWALTQFAARGAGQRYSDAGHRALRCARELAARAENAGPAGWCSGTAGVLTASACLMDGAGRRSAALALAGRPLTRDLSLCHGELGIADALNVLAAQHPDAVPASARRNLAGLILGAVSQYRLACGTPGGIATPGLLSGLAGIGYGLLRLGFAQRVPSALFLEPGGGHTVQPDPALGNQPSQRPVGQSRRE
ncbi:MAG TPA: type 2 lanthipeptide synthetase LanM family protein [Streptosporangiaceae bacterium]